MVTNQQNDPTNNQQNHHRPNHRVMIHGFDMSRSALDSPIGWYPGTLNNDSQLDPAKSTVEVTDQSRFPYPKGPPPTAGKFDQVWDETFWTGVKPWQEELWPEVDVGPSGESNPLELEENLWKDSEASVNDTTSDIFCDTLISLVNNSRRQFESMSEEDKRRLPANHKRIVDDLYKVCQDNEKLKAMCTYYFLKASSEAGLTIEMEAAIAKQPWGKTGKDAWQKYDRYMSENEHNDLVKENLLQSLLKVREIHLARCTIPSDVMDALFPGAKKQVFIKDARYGQRRPSARIGVSQGQSSHQNTNSEPNLPVWRPGKEPVATPNAQNLRRAQTPPHNSPGKRPSTQDSHGRRPESAGNGPGASTQGQPNVLNQLGTKKASQPNSRGPPMVLIGANNKLVPLNIDDLSHFDRIMYDVVRNYLGDNHPLSHYGGLKAQLDHMIKIFMRFQTGPVSGPNEAFHVTIDHCESDDDTPTGCAPACGRPQKVPNCYKRMHVEMRYFLGLQDWLLYQKEFGKWNNFLLCFTRAITIIVNDYCLRNKVPQPAFYPTYIETGLVKWLQAHPQQIEGEVSHLARVQGIREDQVEWKLTMLRARAISNNDELTQMAGDQMIGKQHELAKNPPQIFKGPKAHFTLPDIFRSHFRRWMADNRHKLGPENRYPDDATLAKLIDELKKQHTTHCTDDDLDLLTKDLILEYMQNFQDRNLPSFPLLEANADPTQPVETIVLSSDSE